jgi:acyl-CoA thioester hydrolase
MLPDNAHQPYEIEISIKPSDIDLIGHVNNVVYLQWVQDAAVAHWSAQATEAQKNSLLWVVVKHEIEYKRPAYEGDKVIARTWVGKATRRGFERYTDLLRQSDRKLLAKAKTLWSPIDSHTKQSVKVGTDIYERFSVQDQE